MILFNGIRRKIKQIKTSQRSSHAKIIEVLGDIVKVIEERTGGEISVEDIVKELEKDGKE